MLMKRKVSEKKQKKNSKYLKKTVYGNKGSVLEKLIFKSKWINSF